MDCCTGKGCINNRIHVKLEAFLSHKWKELQDITAELVSATQMKAWKYAK